MNKQPLLSIVIPTKNRYETLIPVIKETLKYIESLDYEIVIQDNSDRNEIMQDFLSQNSNFKLKYFYYAGYLSMTDNTNMAIINSSGKYAIFIGDDDLVSPYVVEITKLMDTKNIDCLIYPPCYYWWSSVIFAKETPYCKNETFWIPPSPTMKLHEKSASKELAYVLKKGSHYFDLPRFYHGIVKREILEKIKERTGTYQPGACPDISFAVSIALVLEKYYYINYPLSVFGASKNSGAGWGASNTHYGEIEEMTFLPKGLINHWDPLLPRIWSAYTTNAQAIYDVFKAFSIDKEIDYIAFYASMLANEPILKKYIFPVVKIYCRYNPIKYGKLLSLYLRGFLKIIIMPYYLMFRFKTGQFKYKIFTVKSIEECMDKLKKYPIDA